MRSLTTCAALLAGTAALCATSPALAQSVRIAPTDVRGIRNSGGGPFLLTFLAIKAGTEDRTVMEFDLRPLPWLTPWGYLELGMSNIDPGPPDGVVDIFTYSGDGVVQPAEFSAGVFDSAFVYNDGPGIAHPGVTLGHEELPDFLGVRLSTTTSDRFWLGSIIGQPEPVLVVGTCEPDCDYSTGAGVLDIFDFLCFQNRWLVGDYYACLFEDNQGPETCDIFDFLEFQNAFARGCR